MRKIFSYAVILFCLNFAGEKLSAQDTLLRKLDSLRITSARNNGAAANRSFSKGTKIRVFTLKDYPERKMATLAEFIKEETALNIKENGKGAGSYLSVRGTSSSHTKITWNDLDISFPTMGVTDFSLIPVYLVDAIELHTGGNSTVNGEGSIGGALRLNTIPEWKNGVHGDVLVSAGSYNNFFSGATVIFTKKSFESRTSLYGEVSENDYTFRNNTVPGYPWERLNNASAHGNGLLQEINKRFGENSMLTISLLTINHLREIQPTVSNNENPVTYASISDKMLRTSVKYSANAGRFRYTTSLSYACNDQEYEGDKIAANKVSALLESDYTFQGFSIKAGITSDYTKPQVYSYDSGTHELRTNIYTLARYIPVKNLILSAGVRQMWVTGVVAPLMPSFDAKFIVKSGINQTLSLRGSISRSIKVPTLNDRYWGGNNLYLKSERSFTAETGADYSLMVNKTSADAWFTIYRSDVRDWIRWLPAGSVWRPQNIPSVLSTGLEAGIKVSGKIGELNCGVNANYNYSNIRMLESLMPEDPSVGKQLAYQPRHLFNTTLKAEHSGLTLFFTTLYTGRRTTVDIFDIMPAYLVFDAGAIYKFKLLGYKWTSTAKIMNLADKQYQNIKFYAMPGINFRASLQWNF